MSYLSDGHKEWHAVNGADNPNCPLDCGAGYDYEDEEYEYYEKLGNEEVNYPS